MAEPQKTLCASYLILEKDGKVLLMKRKNTGFRDGWYSLVAGHVDEGETFKQAMIREAEEEIGVKLSEDQLEVVEVLHRNSDSDVYVDIFFKTENWKGNVQNKEEEKCAELSWFEVDNLPEKTLDYVENAVFERDKSQGYSEYGW